MNDEEIIAVLKNARIRLDLGQKPVGDLAMCAQTDISRWERGAASPRLSHVVRWANALGYDIVLQKKDH